MSKKTDTGTQTLDSSSDTINLKTRQESEIGPQVIETTADELTLRLVNEQIKQATDAILSRVQDLYALLAGGTELNLLETVKRPFRGLTIRPLVPQAISPTYTHNYTFG